jgi:hypothetical protein
MTAALFVLVVPTQTRRIINELHKRLRSRLSKMQPEADAFRARAFKGGNVGGPR